MRYLKLQLAVAAFLAVGVTAPTEAHNVGLRHTAQHRYNECQRKFKHQNHARACGRNIVQSGWKEKGKPAKEPNRKQVAKWSRALNRLNHPMVYLNTRGVPPRTPTANGAATPAYSPTGLAACIVNVESGGNSQAVNGSYSGIAQWSNEAWNRHQKAGGHYFSSTPLGATKQQQLVVLNDGLTHFGCRDWCPFEHGRCG